MNSTTAGVSLISQENYLLAIELLHVPLILFSLGGTVTNSINTMVFLKQGLTRDTTNVSLFAISVSDCLSSVLIFPQLFCFYVDALEILGKGKSCFLITSMATTYPRIMCTKFTCFIQSYICVERAICVALPVQVKRLITLRTAVVVNVVMCVGVLAIFTPYAANVKLVNRAYGNGSSRTVLVFTSLGESLINFNYIMSSFVLANTSILVIGVATVVVVTRLNISRKWRESVTRSTKTNPALSKSQTVSSRNLEVTKTITAVTSVYLISVVCGQIPALASFVLPGVTAEGENRFLYNVIFTLRFAIEATYSSINLFLYLKMSTKYRKAFYMMFSRATA